MRIKRNRVSEYHRQNEYSTDSICNSLRSRRRRRRRQVRRRKPDDRARDSNSRKQNLSLRGRARRFHFGTVTTSKSPAPAIPIFLAYKCTAPRTTIDPTRSIHSAGGFRPDYRTDRERAADFRVQNRTFDEIRRDFSVGPALRSDDDKPSFARFCHPKRFAKGPRFADDATRRTSNVHKTGRGERCSFPGTAGQGRVTGP